MVERADNMNYAEAIQFLYDLRMFGAKFGLAVECNSSLMQDVVFLR